MRTLSRVDILAREQLFAEGSITMTVQVSRVLQWSLVFILCLGTFVGGSSTGLAGNRCKDRCNDVYRLRKDVCKAIPLKGERKVCERAAKRAKDDCKHRCR